MLNMLPKFELVPIRRYFVTLPKARRPARDIPDDELVSIRCTAGCRAGRLARLSRDPDITASDAPPSAKDRYFGHIATCLTCGSVARDARNWSGCL